MRGDKMPRTKKQKRKKIVKNILLSIVISVVSIGLYVMYDRIEVTQIESMQSVSGTKTSTTIETVEKKSKEIAQVVEEVSSCVVGISKLQENGSSIFLQNAEQSLGLGTGVIISDSGYILTNQHVAGDRYGKCYVTLDTGKEYSAEVVWADSDIDLAIIKINAITPTYVKVGDSDSIRVGEAVYAIGNPIGFEFMRTVTSGIVSALDRTIQLEETVYMADLIQTDATINPGSSGGPLITPNGEVIGINSVKITSAEGIGFAIPINLVKPIIERITTEKEFVQPTLGIFAYDKEVIPYLEHNISLEHGIYVAQVNLDGPANTLLKTGDIITKIDDVELDKMNDLRKYIYTKNPGDTVSLTVLRNNKETIVVVKLGKK